MPSVIGGSHKLNSGHDIPLIGFGTFRIKGQEEVDIAIDEALAAGYRLIDTARRYGNEQEIGNALQELLPKHNLKRSDIFITTKVFLRRENSRNATREDVEDSLKLLKTDYLDLVLIHHPHITEAGVREESEQINATCRKDVYLELEKLSEEGKIRSIGISNYEIRHIEELKKYSTIAPAANQCEFHPHFTRNELVAYCKKENIFFQAYSSLGKYNPSLINEPVIVDLAEKHKATVSQILLAYALEQDIGIIPKSSTPSRIHENMGVVNVKLSKEEIDKLTALNRDQKYAGGRGRNVVQAQA